MERHGAKATGSRTACARLLTINSDWTGCVRMYRLKTHVIHNHDLSVSEPPLSDPPALGNQG